MYKKASLQNDIASDVQLPVHLWPSKSNVCTCSRLMKGKCIVCRFQITMGKETAQRFKQNKVKQKDLQSSNRKENICQNVVESTTQNTEPLYCTCYKPDDGTMMVGCDNDD